LSKNSSNREAIRNTLQTLREQELSTALMLVPKDKYERFALFLETMRTLDCLNIFGKISEDSPSIRVPDLDIINYGWNLSLCHLYCDIGIDGIPAYKSTKETRELAARLLHKFGRVVLLKRTSDMLYHGQIDIEKENKNLRIKSTDKDRLHFLDQIEFSLEKDLHKRTKDSIGGAINGWKIDEYKSTNFKIQEPGAFFLHRSTEDIDKYYIKDLEPRMEKLVFPWDSGKGIMTGYDAEPDIDDHFMVDAFKSVLEMASTYGIHPSIQINSISGAELIAVSSVIFSFHQKHLKFVEIATKKFPEVSLEQSLTIWTQENVLIEELSNYTGLSKAKISKVLDLITFRAEDRNKLRDHTANLIPLLIRAGNSSLMRPLSSITRNPFPTISTMIGSRIKGFSGILNTHREEWLRKDLYHMFLGKRYHRVEGNIKLRKGNKVITDIDGAIIDKTSGDLAIIQIKWQDYFTNDVNKIRSKASNFTDEIEAWSEKVETWIDENGVETLRKALRLRKDIPLKKVFLFGISKTQARMEGYGFKLSSRNIAVANWPLFTRKRFEVGSTNRVFRDLFYEITENNRPDVKFSPIPIEVKIEETTLIYEDTWIKFDT